MRVVLYAEGPLETRETALGPAPGTALNEDELGPAHVLVRRCLGSCGFDSASVVSKLRSECDDAAPAGATFIDPKH